MSKSNPFEGSKFDPSIEGLPPSDPRDAAIKVLAAKCREIVETCHALQNLDRELFDAERGGDFKTGVRLGREHGIKEEHYWNLRNEIAALEEKANKVDGLGICVVHTAGGTPIRVDEKCKKRPWDN